MYCILLEQVSIPPAEVVPMPKYTPADDGAIGVACSCESSSSSRNIASAAIVAAKVLHGSRPASALAPLVDYDVIVRESQ